MLLGDRKGQPLPGGEAGRCGVNKARFKKAFHGGGGGEHFMGEAGVSCGCPENSAGMAAPRALASNLGEVVRAKL